MHELGGVPGSGWPADRGRDQRHAVRRSGLCRRIGRPPRQLSIEQTDARARRRPPQVRAPAAGRGAPRIASGQSALEGRTLTDKMLQEAALAAAQGGDGMTAFATLLTPVRRQPRDRAGQHLAQAHPAGGRDRVPGPRSSSSRAATSQGLVAAWRDRAYDQVPLQFADAANTHTNDPGAHARLDHRTWSSSRTGCTSRPS